MKNEKKLKGFILLQYFGKINKLTIFFYCFYYFEYRTVLIKLYLFKGR